MIDITLTGNAQNIVKDAIMACTTLESFLKEENDALKKGQLPIIEENLKNKQRLAAKVERLMMSIKQHQAEIHASPSLKNDIEGLKKSFASYQDEARHNMILLQSAHQSTTDVLNALRSAVDTHYAKNEAKTYGKDGSVKTTGSGQKVMTKEI